jgi:DNA-binding MarR family transcriptional regulator
MTGNLKEEIKQTRPFASLETEAFLNLKRTCALFEQQLTELLKPYNLTPTQYNVLRILRGAGAEGLCRYEVGDRLVAPGPDVTRLLDRLEKGGVVVRVRAEEDHRLVKASITKEGLDVLASLDDPIRRLHVTQFGHLGKDGIRDLIDLLTNARLNPEPQTA